MSNASDKKPWSMPKPSPKSKWSLFSRKTSQNATDKKERKSSLLPSKLASASQPSLPSNRRSGILGLLRRRSVDRLGEIPEEPFADGVFKELKSIAENPIAENPPTRPPPPIPAPRAEKPVKQYVLSTAEKELCKSQPPLAGFNPLKSHPTKPDNHSTGVKTEARASKVGPQKSRAADLPLRHRPAQAGPRTIDEVQREDVGSRFSWDTDTSEAEAEAGPPAPTSAATTTTTTGASPARGSPMTWAQSTPNLAAVALGAALPKSASTSTMVRRHDTTTSFLESPTSSEASSPRLAAAATTPEPSRAMPTALSFSRPPMPQSRPGLEERRPRAAPLPPPARSSSLTALTLGGAGGVAQRGVAAQHARGRRGAEDELGGIEEEGGWGGFYHAR